LAQRASVRSWDMEVPYSASPLPVARTNRSISRTVAAIRREAFQLAGQIIFGAQFADHYKSAAAPSEFGRARSQAIPGLLSFAMPTISIFIQNSSFQIATLPLYFSTNNQFQRIKQMNQKMNPILIVLFFMFLLTASKIANACSCAGNPLSVCAAYAGADAVFIGSVNKVEQPKSKKNDSNSDEGSGQIARIQVERVFKGNVGAEAIFRTRGTSCDVSYKEGDRWLFYAHYSKEYEAWMIGVCGPSKHVENAAEDMLYLQGLPASAQQTRIAGTLEHYEDDPEKGFTRVGSISNAKVKLIGESKTYEVYTDANGVYEIFGLPPGKYAISPEIPPGLGISSATYFGDVAYSEKRSAKIVLQDKSCAGADFTYSNKTEASISGKVLGADGRLLPGVCLNLQPKGKSATRTWRFDCTDEEGGYELKEIPPGEYIIVVNFDGRISGRAPFPTAYYPGEFEKEKATVIHITKSDKLENYDINIPSQEATAIFQGILLYADGRPVAKEFVGFEADKKVNKVKKGYEVKFSTVTDSQGRFSLPVLKGLEGRLYGHMEIYKGKFVNCPELERLIGTKGKSYTEIETESIRLKVEGDIQGVKLVFHFSSCERAGPR
jgi:hypothetical protein